jgi:diphosphomevalonate decarboxylase
MWNKHQVVEHIIGKQREQAKAKGKAFAPSNIALCKYWGKRDAELNLPVTSSLSVSLHHLGTVTEIMRATEKDHIVLNGIELDEHEPFAKRLITFLDLYRPHPEFKFKVNTSNNIPTAAGLASSASGFAAMVLALDDFFAWNLSLQDLSILARMGSGSAARSLMNGFVLWQAGSRSDGMDSFAKSLDIEWPEFRIGVLTLSDLEKSKSSRQAMTETVNTSILYKSWPAQVSRDLDRLLTAIQNKDIQLCGETAEQNALSMHATMIASWPPTLYWLAETVSTLNRVWEMRKQGIPVYITMDAGPNIKLIFEKNISAKVRENFKCEIIAPFASFSNLNFHKRER